MSKSKYQNICRHCEDGARGNPGLSALFSGLLRFARNDKSFDIGNLDFEIKK